MAKQHQHSILSQRYLLTLEQAEQAGAYQSRISQLQHNRVSRLLEKVLTKFSREGKVFQFDQVTLDLGTIHPDNFENEVVYRLEEQLSHFLQTSISADGTVLGGHSIDLSERQLELLAYFLVNGTMPWSTSGNEQPEAVFRQLLEQQNKGLLELLNKQGPRENVRKRMILQFTDETLSQTVRFATHNEGEYILDFREHLISRQKKSNIPESNPGHFSKAVWEVILAYIFVETRSYYNKKYFLKYVIRQIARQYNYSYAVLLQFMASELKTKPRVGQAATEFNQILQNLHTETGIPEENPEIPAELDEQETLPVDAQTWMAAFAYFLNYGSFESKLFHLSAEQLNKQIIRWIGDDKPAAKTFFAELMPTDKQHEVFRNLSRLEHKPLQLIFKLIEFKPLNKNQLEIEKILDFISGIEAIPSWIIRELRRQQYKLALSAWLSNTTTMGGLIDLLLRAHAGFAQLEPVVLKQLHAGISGAFPAAVQQSIWLRAGMSLPEGKNELTAFAQTRTWLQSWAQILQSRLHAQMDPEKIRQSLLQEVRRMAAWLRKPEKQLLAMLLQSISKQQGTIALQQLVKNEIANLTGSSKNPQEMRDTTATNRGVSGLSEDLVRLYADQLLQAMETRQSDPVFARLLSDRLNSWSKKHKITFQILISQLTAQLSEWRQGISGQSNETLIAFLHKLPAARQQPDPAQNYTRDLVRYYAANGNLPWWSGPVSNRALNEYFMQFCAIEPAEAVQFLHQSNTRKNLFSLLQEKSWLQLVATLQVPFNAHILQIFFRLESLLSKELKILYPGFSVQLYEARYALLNRVLKHGSHLRKDEWVPVFIEEMSRQSGLAEIDLLQLVAQRLHQDRPQGIRRMIENQLRKLQVVSEIPELSHERSEEQHPFYKLLFEPGAAGSNQPRLEQDKLLAYLADKIASKTISLPEKFKNHTVRKNMLEKLSRENIVQLAALNFSETDQKSMDAAVNMLRHLKKYMTLTQFDNVWHHFFDAVFLKIALDKQSPWKIADWSWMISQSVEAVLYKDKATAILNQLIDADSVRKAQPTEWKMLQHIRKTVKLPSVPKPAQPLHHPHHTGMENNIEPAKGDILFVDGAGVVLLGPYIPLLFERLQLTEGGEFRDETCRAQAIHLLHFAACGLTGAAEHELALYKLLCGLDVSAPIVKDAEITETQKSVVEELLVYVISQWEALKNTSPEGLRGTFLVRSGKLVREEEFDRILVEHKAFDILLTKVPWSFSQLKFRWMPRLLTIEWIQ